MKTKMAGTFQIYKFPWGISIFTDEEILGSKTLSSLYEVMQLSPDAGFSPGMHYSRFDLVPIL